MIARDVLQEIGLSAGEIDVYIALLRLGETTAGPIVVEARVTRSKIYDILERLKQKGLISEVIKSGTKHFSAAPPISISQYLEDKEAVLSLQKKKLDEVLPGIEQLYNSAMSHAFVQVFVGVKGVQHAFSLIAQQFTKGKEYYAFGAGKGSAPQNLLRFFEQFHMVREKAGVQTKILFTHDVKGNFPLQESSDHTQIRYLLQTSPTAINIYEDAVMIVILVSEPIALFLRHKEAAESFRDYFRELWAVAEK